MVGDALMLALIADVFHAYVLAPVAVRVAEFPIQMVALFTVIVGVGLTVMVVVFVAVHPLVVPVIV